MGDRWQLQEAKNRLSELVRKACDEGPQVITVHGADAAVVVSAEQYAKLAEGKRRTRLRAWVQRDLVVRFAGRLLPIDLQVADRWGTLVGESERKGVPLPVIDSLIAATCLVHGLTAVTRNCADFERCGVECFSPWSR